MKDIQKIESKGMKIAVFILLFMGALGIIVSQIANSGAILIDGIFSLISATTTLIAIKVSTLLTKENEKYPFGYAGYEMLYVALRSFLLTITVLMALLDSISKILTYFTTGNIPQVNTKIFMIYVLFIAFMYVILNIHYNKYCKLSNGKSELLSAEKFNAKANSLLMLGVGGSFIFIGLLKYTPLKFLVPISDSIIVFFIALMVAIDSSKLFVKTISILGGKGIIGEEKEELRKCIKEKFENEIDIMKLRVQKIGKTAYIVVEVDIKGENIEKTRIKKICKTIKDSVKEKYEINHTYISFA